MNGSQKVDVICRNRPQNTLKWHPEDREMMSKQVLVIIRVMSRTPEQNFIENIEQISTKISTYAKIGHENTQNGH